MSDEQETEATEQVVNQGRRSAMKKITVGVGVLAGLSALPEQWSRPIIGQIVLPAHAATSGSTLHDPCAVELRGGDHTTTTVIIKVTGFVTPPVANLPVTITATPVLSGVKKEAVKANTTTSATGTFEVIMTIGGGPGITSVNVSTSVTGADGVANCVVHTTAASTNTCSVSGTTWRIVGNAVEDALDITVTLHANYTITGDRTGSWSFTPNTLTIIAIGNPTTDTIVGNLTVNCNSMSGSITTTVGGEPAGGDTIKQGTKIG